MALTNRDAQIVLGMVNRGDKDHDIAAWFGENQARIAEVKDGSHGQQNPAKKEELPPRGAPGPKGRLLRGSVKNAIAKLESGDAVAALADLKTGLSKYNKHEA